ncbi:tRNA (adenosine(37)-N6)-dimethylallyltransferase MiaA [Roseibacterium beibuensis]|uniref:tRNA (adenosine(37)-N6)-dimethylallyltransferase MiaA n=1 Tax=[Roseibacterium] beibuensis TaxID=1193142 RepID=UPI00217D4335|nr:tRNA (adenosine(37)-N6)-dimethylallyltransferase MiaA [Roseibacterium beibuensis]MCS6624903.1 tRNA (adenosine(37)-N6)-dimethylallyltransferase MiaA [Roseibacterium beibuensis]
MTDPRITLIAGPTASGKSALALELAERTGAVIVNADSQQLYADLRVLSARPSAEEEARAEHRLYGVADAAEAWSVGRWSRAAMELLAGLDGRPVLFVGGTGLYFTVLTKGLATIPDIPVEVRDAASAAFDAEGEAAFRRRLAERDPAAAARIEAGDRQRLTRAMAVAEHTGRALSDWTAETTPLLAPGSWTGLVVEPDRAALYARCDARVARMVEAGALDEVRALVARDLDPALPAMKAVGVREFAAHLAGEMTLAAAVEATRQATRNYAKRQLTWFRNQTPEWTRARP